MSQLLASAADRSAKSERKFGGRRPAASHGIEGGLSVWLRTAVLLSAIAFAVPLSSAQRRVRVPRRVVRVYVAGQRVRFDRVQPLNVGRRILVPMRGVFEKMGATVRYDHLNERVYAKRGNRTVMLNLNRRVAYVNGKPHRLDTWPKISKGHVLVPIRFIAEALNATAVYSAPNYTVRIFPH